LPDLLISPVIKINRRAGTPLPPNDFPLESIPWFHHLGYTEKTDAIAALAALAQDTRLDVFRLLVQAGAEGLPPGQIGERLDLPSATLSFHLNQLRHAGLVTFRREGRSLIYVAEYDAMNGLLAYLTENCCQGDPAACSVGVCDGAKIVKSKKVRISLKRLHVHVSVEDIAQSVRFYSTLFAAEPAVIKTDYAKWMLEDPRVNFAISTRSGETGLDHLGIQVETAGELQDVYGRLQQADRPVLEEGATTCCYARSQKAWITDPQGLSWETFLTSGESTVYGDSVDLGPIRTKAAGACCTPQTAQGACCDPKPELAADAPCCG
jgi:DNA-binding transcriptional ArsR family regulator